MVTDAFNINHSSAIQAQRNAFLSGHSGGDSMPESGKILPKPLFSSTSNTTSTASTIKDSRVVDQEVMQKVTDHLNQYAQFRDLKLQFSLDDESGRPVIRVINKETDEVIRQFPPEEILYLSKMISSSNDSMFGDHSGLLVQAEV